MVQTGISAIDVMNSIARYLEFPPKLQYYFLFCLDLKIFFLSSEVKKFQFSRLTVFLTTKLRLKFVAKDRLSHNLVTQVIRDFLDSVFTDAASLTKDPIRILIFWVLSVNGIFRNPDNFFLQYKK